MFETENFRNEIVISLAAQAEKLHVQFSEADTIADYLHRLAIATDIQSKTQSSHANDNLILTDIDLFASIEKIVKTASSFANDRGSDVIGRQDIHLSVLANWCKIYPFCSPVK
jgi:hypothetical protein